MDLQKAILQEHSRKQAVKIADYVKDNSSRFKVLIDVYLAGPYRVTQRAAWPLSLCVERYPQMIKPHLKVILNYLEHPGIHDAVKRNTMRLLQHCEIPRRYYGQVASLAFQYLQDKRAPVAVKAFSITVLSRIAENEPDLKNELKIILEDQLPYATPAFVVRARRALKSMAY